MKNRQWKDWTEPLEVLLAKTREFLDTLKSISSLTDMPIGGKVIGLSDLNVRRGLLYKALATCVRGPSQKNLYGEDREPWTSDFLSHYLYVSSVYEDAMVIVFEYIGENEHQMTHHGDEFAQTKAELIEDFALYAENWLS